MILLGSCGGSPAARAPQITRLDPDFTGAGRDFNVQPSGESALAVSGSNFPPDAVVTWNGQPLKTSAHGAWLGAAVPRDLYASPGVVQVAVRAGGRSSNTLSFTVYASTGPAPNASEVYPAGTTAGKPFNVQPGGEAAIGVTGNGFLPGAAIRFDGKALRTDFKSPSALSAAVPSDLFSRAHEASVWVVNPDGKVSGKLRFVIQP